MKGLIRKYHIFLNLRVPTATVRHGNNSSLQIARTYCRSKINPPDPSNFRPSVEKSRNISPFGIFLLAAPLTTLGLSIWQFKRKTWKENLIAELKAKSEMVPIDLPESLEKIGDSMEYCPVKVRGTFMHDKELYMGPRSLLKKGEATTSGGLISQNDGGIGYHVITPFKLEDRDDVILVNRGWIPKKHLNPKTRPNGQLKGSVELTGIVRKNEARPQFTPSHTNSDTFLYRDLERMCQLTGATPVFLDARHETTVSGGPIGGQTRIGLRNEHLQYALTWISLSAFTSYLWYVKILK